ncbi:MULTISPECIES: DUF417 family protein [Myxococcus]|uniref:DUF417 domain-containing protein n=1 Tax=Myxococcus xanthus TaxID=34 RepID=A0AAE6KU97_MYXXA|nr:MULTISPECIES: DUF417 family protein [Myxococcus]QDE70208.1 hypothetical protein BHS09_26345 [Myxococcus xanthus]QDE77487.1 hypothetical protein BHS08_26365 [Myxococcus xanthus]QDE99033.1 hypothetical protein BHS05_26155 [Myxococcus xanthus]QDF06708.1 hypothetical protein BHS04_26465 [Myxococcus xanthus]WAM24315.1 DUF417 family protein [Myxococcus sp. NMCA1]
MSRIESLLRLAARADRIGMNVLRAGLIVVLVWIGALKVAEYEADGIVPFVANSPVMSFVYTYDAPEYRQHMNAEGALVPANRAWHEANGTYGFSYLLGGVIVLFGLLIAAHWWRPELGAIGSALVIGMSVVTLSFLVTTPESWVPALGDAHHGFPWLSGRGRLVVKDAIMIGAAIVTMADSARVWLAQRKPQPAEQLHRAAA